VPFSLFHKKNDNEHSILRRIHLFFRGFCEILIPFSVPITVTLRKKEMKMSFGDKKLTKRWDFIPTKKFWEDFSQEITESLKIIKKDPLLFRSLMWLGHRLESNSDIQSFLDCYRILETLSNREFDFMLSDIDVFLNNNPKWITYVKCKKPLKFRPEGRNLVEAYAIHRWNMKKTEWGLVKKLRDSITHGENPDIEFKEYFRNTFVKLNDYIKKILKSELEHLLKTDILIAGEEKLVTITPDKKFIMKPLHQCSKNLKNASEYRIEGLSKKKFENIISSLNIDEVKEFELYYQYRSNNILAKNVPLVICKENEIIMINHDHGGSIHIKGDKKK